MFRLLLFLLILSPSAWAKVELLFMSSPNYSEILVIPKKDHEQPEEALQRYEESLEESHNLSKYHKGFSEIRPQIFFNNLPKTQATLVVANDGRDMNTVHQRLKTVTNPLHKADTLKQRSLAVLPVGATLRLSSSEREEFHRLVAKRFSLLVLMGGEDVHPLFYGEKVTHAVNTNSVRDFLEIRLIRDFYRFGQGIIFGICRGSQITNVTFGGKLHQDLNHDQATENSHRDGVEHAMKLITTRDHFFKEVIGEAPVSINSYHHQALKKLSPNSIIEVAGYSDDGVPEAFTSKDGIYSQKGRVILVQFHPELNPTLETIGNRMFSLLTERAREPHSCRRVHR